MSGRKGHPLNGEMLQRTLDLLILQTLIPGPALVDRVLRLVEE